MPILTEKRPQRKASLSQRFTDCRQLTEAICTPLEVEDYVPQPMVDVSPPKWHLGHSSWFFEQFVLVPNVPGYTIFHDDFAYLFNSYYNHAGNRVLRPNRGLMSRPPVREIFAYRQHVTEALLEYLKDGVPENVLDIIELGINHEQQHQELLLYDIKFILGNQPTFPVYGAGYELRENTAKCEFIPFQEGLYGIGAKENGFCYDNELGRHQVFLKPFEIASQLVTNGEYIEFIADGAYSDFNLWLSEGWDHLHKTQQKAPLYWHKVEGKWHHYTLNGFKPIHPQQPVQHVSFYEALAFAEWKGMRLPTEFEWEEAADQIQWGQLWEWTYSAYQPYPGFKKAPGALGEYNGKFMINQQVLRGASLATSPGHSRKTYRNFFATPSKWIFSGIRLAR
ncbi:MAG: ergothioneine biosynthesis protein EgtB [Cyclobacteriaceae bacterium]